MRGVDFEYPVQYVRAGSSMAESVIGPYLGRTLFHDPAPAVATSTPGARA